MPRSNYTQRGMYAGNRRCPQCGDIWPATADFFYQRPSSGRLELCQGENTRDCRARYFREYAARNRTVRANAAATAGMGRTFGVEFEFIGCSNAVCDAMRAQGFTDCVVDQYGHEVVTYWRIVPDSSVGGGAELVSPVLAGADGRDQVRRACAALRAAGAGVNRSCGTHVHHGAEDLTARAWGRLFRMWAACQSATDSLVAPSRRDRERREDEHGCCFYPGAVLPTPLVERAAALSGHLSPSACPTRSDVSRFLAPGNRYHTLNADPFRRQGTLEVRQHQGTINAAKILAWIEYVQAMFTYAQGDGPVPMDGATLARTLELLAQYGNLSPVTADYLTARAAILTTCDDEPQRAASDDDDYEYDDNCGCEECHPERADW